MTPDASPGRPGFRAGFGAIFRGAGFLVRTPASWPFAWVPALVLVALALLLGWAAVTAVNAWVDGWLGSATSWYGKASASLLSWLGSILGAILGLLVALALSPPLSAPALERIVGLAERELGVPARSPIGFLAEIWCGLRAQAFAALFAVPTLALLWIAELLFAPAVFVTVPLKLLVSALCLSWTLFDYPLTLRGVRMRERLGLVLRHKAAAVGFGLGFALLFWLPCFGVLLLPVGVAAATRLVWRMLDSSPDLLPELPRASSGPPQSPADVAAGSSARS